MPGFMISNAAWDDLKEIGRYRQDHWGENSATNI